MLLEESANQDVNNEIEFNLLGKEILEKTNDGVIIIQDELVRYFNPRLKEIIDKPADELIDKHFTHLIHPDEIARLKEYRHKLETSDDASDVFETALRRDEDVRVEVELRIERITFRQKPAELLLINDISEQKKLNLMLLHAQRMESIGTLAAGIAHEINTPIQFIGDNTAFFKDSFADLSAILAKYESLLKAVRRETETASIVSELLKMCKEADLDYLRSEIPLALEQSEEGIERVAKIVLSLKEFAHPGPEMMTRFDLNRAIESAVTVARNEWKYVADVSLELDSDLPWISCLPGDVNQVILNLIVNAAHAISEKLGERSDQKGTITITTNVDGDYAEMRIKDSGAGIPDHIKLRIFDPFFTTKDVGKGTGQGLAIAYSVVVEKHGGEIKFDSVLGEGTTFIVRLPINQPEEAD